MPLGQVHFAPVQPLNLRGAETSKCRNGQPWSEFRPCRTQDFTQFSGGKNLNFRGLFFRLFDRLQFFQGVFRKVFPPDGEFEQARNVPEVIALRAPSHTEARQVAIDHRASDLLKLHLKRVGKTSKAALHVLDVNHATSCLSLRGNHFVHDFSNRFVRQAYRVAT